MDNLLSNFVDEKTLMMEEMVELANYGYVEYCDDCGKWCGLVNRYDGDDFVQWTENGKYLYCTKHFKILN